MAIKRITASISHGDGEHVQVYSANLTYDETNGAYKGTLTAFDFSSYNNNSEHYFPMSILAEDDAGNTTIASATTGNFTDQLKLRVLEKVSPSITGMTITDGSYITNAQPTFSFEVTDEGSGIVSDNVILTADGAAIAPSGAGLGATAIEHGYTFTYTPTEALSDGSHVFTIDATDNDGNAAPTVTVNFVVDTIAPTLTVTEPSDNYHTNKNSVVIKGTTSDSTSTPVSVTINGQSVTVGSDGSFTYTYTGLTEGDNLITVIASDSAGKQTTVTRTVVVDTSAPVFESITVTPNPVDAGKTFVITVKIRD